MSAPGYTDPRLLARLAKLEEPVHPRDYAPQLSVKPVRALLDPESWRAGFVRISVREQSSDIYHAMQERTPQALLRDLHRPEYDFREITRNQVASEHRVGMPLRDSTLGYPKMERLRAALSVWDEERLSWLEFVNRPWPAPRADAK